jgi:hypothetical protein
MTNKTRTRALRGAVVAGVMALLMAPVAAVQAAPAPVFFVLTGGSVAVDGLGDPAPIPPGSASVGGNWDADTGAFTDGVLSVDPIVIEVLPGVNAEIILESGAVTGTIPADGSPATVNVANAGLRVKVALLGADCTLNLGTLALSGALDASGDPVTLSLGGEFEVTSPPAVTDTCTADTIALLGNYLTFPLQVALLLDFEAGEAPAPEPEEEVVVEAEVEVVEAAPKFTG